MLYFVDNIFVLSIQYLEFTILCCLQYIILSAHGCASFEQWHITNRKCVWSLFFFTPQHCNSDNSLQHPNFITTCCSIEHVQDENYMHYSVTFYLLPEVNEHLKTKFIVCVCAVPNTSIKRNTRNTKLSPKKKVTVSYRSHYQKPHTTDNDKWLTYWCVSHYVLIQLFYGANSGNSQLSTKFSKVILT